MLHHKCPAGCRQLAVVQFVADSQGQRGLLARPVVLARLPTGTRQLLCIQLPRGRRRSASGMRATARSMGDGVNPAGQSKITEQGEACPEQDLPARCVCAEGAFEMRAGLVRRKAAPAGPDLFKIPVCSVVQRRNTPGPRGSASATRTGRRPFATHIVSMCRAALSQSGTVPLRKRRARRRGRALSAEPVP